MPTITIENDETIYTFASDAMKGKGELHVDALELASRLARKGIDEGNDPTPEQMASAVKDVMWGEVRKEDLTTDELFRVGAKVMQGVVALGNELGSLLNSSPPTASSQSNGAVSEVAAS